MELLSEIMSHDEDMINFGSDASEYFIGWNAMKTSIEEMLPLMSNIQIEVRDQKIKISENADFAWFTEIWDWNLSIDGNQVSIPGQRLSGVLQKKNGVWQMVQFHNSVPVGTN
jgi:hypothetical protein